MRLKDRLSPYPILDDYSDDYINSSFTAKYELTLQFKEIYGKIQFQLHNKEIQDLIKDKKAEFLVHIECSYTCYRKKFSSFENEIEFKLKSVDLAQTIEIRTFVVLVKDVTGFASSDFHPDYLGQIFNLQAHQIIAIGTAKDFKINKDDKDLESFPSILKIVKITDKRKESLSVDTDEDNYILIGLSEEIYELYANLGKNLYKATAFSLILLPAMMIVLERMYRYKEDEDFNSKHWVQVMQYILEKNKVSLDKISIENDTLLTLSQSIFADPIGRSFQELESCSERME